MSPSEIITQPTGELAGNDLGHPSSHDTVALQNPADACRVMFYLKKQTITGTSPRKVAFSVHNSVISTVTINKWCNVENKFSA